MSRSRVLVRLLLGAVAAALVAVLPAADAAPLAGSMTPSRCIRGDWRTTNVEANAVLDRLVGNPQMKVSRGVLTTSFGTGEMRYGSTFFQLALSIADLRLKGTGNFVYAATYRVRGNRILLGRGTSEVNISKFSARKGGRTITVDGPGPTTRTIPAGTVPFTCSGDTLRWNPPVGGPSGARVTFNRVG